MTYCIQSPYIKSETSLFIHIVCTQKLLVFSLNFCQLAKPSLNVFQRVESILRMHATLFTSTLESHNLITSKTYSMDMLVDHTMALQVITQIALRNMTQSNRIEAMN